ncbi:ERBB-3 BINDING PROTEIN 1-like [Alnus glutinosa]|uniref:ERBB-3 BINDING PROTEIN 1-like n=1 Tax=Alnus glutinosa TaxID=3517 RepID=UPI002D785771|nr:ERBB-3 BINDING PROTEIN 1-like [Alnus glutinosa]XP_062166542.1 ERBB-3 BINDING PROTEIN 1-like [Alnus glutinosa]XP_062166543.1 ERBB-3 BINDING PROTEIN 1-like [Alnus glutinosa]XP_062166544.1 ERBB-3 BINDING PROTEIN 1-like [Alnus glutinosa]
MQFRRLLLLMTAKLLKVFLAIRNFLSCHSQLGVLCLHRIFKTFCLLPSTLQPFIVNVEFLYNWALDEKRARLGLVECVNHELLQPYPVLHEKPGDYVAHTKFTVLLMPNGSDRVTSHPLQELQPTKTIDDPEIEAWLALGTKTKKKVKKGDKAEKSTEAEPMDATTNGATSQD